MLLTNFVASGIVSALTLTQTPTITMPQANPLAVSVDSVDLIQAECHDCHLVKFTHTGLQPFELS